MLLSHPAPACFAVSESHRGAVMRHKQSAAGHAGVSRLEKVMSHHPAAALGGVQPVLACVNSASLASHLLHAVAGGVWHTASVHSACTLGRGHGGG